MTEAEYQTQKSALEAQKTDIDAQLAALELEYVAAVNEYPKWVYHETEGSKIVNSAEEEAALGAGWSASPGGPVVEPGAKKPNDKAKLGEAKYGKASEDEKKPDAGEKKPDAGRMRG